MAIHAFISRMHLIPFKDLEASRSALSNFMHPPHSPPHCRAVFQLFELGDLMVLAFLISSLLVFAEKPP